MKIPRSKDEPGKGGFWKLDLDRLDDGQRSRRRLGLKLLLLLLYRHTPYHHRLLLIFCPTLLALDRRSLS